MTLAIAVYDCHHHTVVAPVGELDLDSSATFRDVVRRVCDRGCVDLLVDLDRVSFMDATGLGSLLDARSVATDAGGTMALLCENRLVRRLLTLTALEDSFAIASGHPGAPTEAAARPGAPVSSGASRDGQAPAPPRRLRARAALTSSRAWSGRGRRPRA